MKVKLFILEDQNHGEFFVYDSLNLMLDFIVASVNAPDMDCSYHDFTWKKKTIEFN